MSDLSMIDLALNNDFSSLEGKTILKVQSLADERGYIETVEVYFSDGSVMRIDTMKKPNGAALFAALYFGFERETRKALG